MKAIPSLLWNLSAVVRPALTLLGIPLFLSGCALTSKPLPNPPHNRTFVTYWPLPQGSSKIRLAIKDNIDMAGVVTTAGSEHFARTRPPAARDAACLALARRSDVHFVGKVNLSEFAVAPSGINDYFGTPRSPLSGWRPLIPGGSSCGSAHAVATGKADVSIGTDTAGSVRVPAACCGVVGLKTTFGLIPIDGIHPIEKRHLDTVGPIAPDIAGAVTGMGLLKKGFAARYQAAVAAMPDPRAIRIGRLSLRGTDRRIDRAVDDALARAQFKVINLDETFRRQWAQASSDGNDVAAGGVWMSNRDSVNRLGVSPRTRSIILVGGVAYKTKYRRALARRDDWQRTLRDVFEEVDFIALPTMQALPPRIPTTLRVTPLKGKAGFKHLENTIALDLLRDPLGSVIRIPLGSLRLLGIDPFEAVVLGMQNTVAVNFAGNPALAMPIPLEDSSIPVTSLQLVGPPRSEAELLALGRLIEASSRVDRESR